MELQLINKVSRVRLSGDSLMLELILTNVLENRAQYLLPQSCLRLTLSRKRDKIILELIDDGDARPSVFRPSFYAFTLPPKALDLLMTKTGVEMKLGKTRKGEQRSLLRIPLRIPKVLP